MYSYLFNLWPWFCFYNDVSRSRTEAKLRPKNPLTLVLLYSLHLRAKLLTPFKRSWGDGKRATSLLVLSLMLNFTSYCYTFCTFLQKQPCKIHDERITPFDTLLAFRESILELEGLPVKMKSTNFLINLSIELLNWNLYFLKFTSSLISSRILKSFFNLFIFLNS